MGNQIKTLKDLKSVAPKFGPDAVEWVKLKIDEAPKGEDEEVLADDTQIIFLLLSLADRHSSMSGKPV